MWLGSCQELAPVAALYLDDGAEPLAVCLILQLLMNMCCRPSSWEAWSAARQLSGACMQPHPVSQ